MMPYMKKAISITIDTELYKRISDLAWKNKLSKSAFIEALVKLALKKGTNQRKENDKQQPN